MTDLLFPVVDLVVLAAISVVVHFITARKVHFTPNWFAWIVIGFYVITSAGSAIFGIIVASEWPWPDYRIQEVAQSAFVFAIFLIPLALRKPPWLLIPLLYMVIGQTLFIVVGVGLTPETYMISGAAMSISGLKAIVTLAAITMSLQKKLKAS